MGNITQALRTAQSGLLVNQRALFSVANNIANVNTDGYSRKIINIQQRVVAGVGQGVVVLGAETGLAVTDQVNHWHRGSLLIPGS